jgi:hypothetical protein
VQALGHGNNKNRGMSPLRSCFCAPGSCPTWCAGCRVTTSVLLLLPAAVLCARGITHPLLLGLPRACCDMYRNLTCWFDMAASCLLLLNTGGRSCCRGGAARLLLCKWCPWGGLLLRAGCQLGPGLGPAAYCFGSACCFGLLAGVFKRLWQLLLLKPQPLLGAACLHLQVRP